jgi:multidrug efflux system membrane fusion protein
LPQGPTEAAPAAAPAQQRAGPAPAAATPAAAPAAQAAAPVGPTPEQRQRMLDPGRNDPETLARRKALLEQIDKGDPAALERWARMQQRRGDAAGEAGRPQAQ